MSVARARKWITNECALIAMQVKIAHFKPNTKHFQLCRALFVFIGRSGGGERHFYVSVKMGECAQCAIGRACAVCEKKNFSLYSLSPLRCACLARWVILRIKCEWRERWVDMLLVSRRAVWRLSFLRLIATESPACGKATSGISHCDMITVTAPRFRYKFSI